MNRSEFQTARSSVAHSFLKMTSTSTFKQMHNHYANQLLFGNLILYWWSVRGNCSTSHTSDVKEHTAQKVKRRGGAGQGTRGSKKLRKMVSIKKEQINRPSTFGTRICTTVREFWHWNRIAKGHFLHHHLERCMHNFFPQCLLYLSLPEQTKLRTFSFWITLPFLNHDMISIRNSKEQ